MPPSWAWHWSGVVGQWWTVSCHAKADAGSEFPTESVPEPLKLIRFPTLYLVREAPVEASLTLTFIVAVGGGVPAVMVCVAEFCRPPGSVTVSLAVYVPLDW